MTRRATWLLPAGLLLFVAILASQGLGAVLSTLALAKWGLLLVALFHGVPLLIDAAAIQVLLDAAAQRGTWLTALLARWVGETANSVMPAGQIGGPVFMVRNLIQRGVPTRQAIAAITVSTTFQTVSQLVFALIGVLLLTARAGRGSGHALTFPLLLGTGLLGLILWLFYRLQRRGLFARGARLIARLSRRVDLSRLVDRAEAIDQAIEDTHARGGRIAGTLLLSLAGWLVGTGEVYWTLEFIGHPVSWSDALLLESLGQAIRGAGFAVPGALGVLEGGYLLLGPLVGLPPQAALALALTKRAREVLWALPGLLWWLRSELIYL
ncbi:MAG TPA: lysylphosphatidylglycerol synthase domain-containing protein [Burkholderiaceae bacterium]|nr:lysylphosphatidylglycerol synthase domain-containing protein [Burkholderiaceae bacterium]